MQLLTSLIGVLGIAGVALGAAGAHALQAALVERGMTGTWQTAVLYHLVHTVAALAVVSRTQSSSGRLWRRAVGAWLCGVLLFSGSLYILALGGPRWLGPVTPLGGVALLLGWGCVFLAGLRRESGSTLP